MKPWSPLVGLALLVALLGGCAGQSIRSQSPEADAVSALESPVQFVEKITSPYNTNTIKVEGAALVTGLDGTGSDPGPSPQRSALLADMQARGVVNPNSVLSNPSNSLVWVRAILPPGIQKGDPVDVEIRVPAQSGTSSLRGGWLMQTRLKPMLLAGGKIRDDGVWALAQGPVMVNPSADPNRDREQVTRGRVLSGGRATRNRKIGLAIKTEDRSAFLSKQIGDAINKRFHIFDRGTQKGVATPKTDAFIEIAVHPRYKHNLPRQMKVIGAIAIYETPTQKVARLELLERQLLDPVTAASAAIRLEAIGKEAIPVLTKGIDPKQDPEVRFYAAEALAYLDQNSSVKPLIEALRNEPSFRAHALTALSTLDDVSVSDELHALLDVPSAETRYGAFRALWAMKDRDPAIRGESMANKFSFHVVPGQGTPMVHCTRSFRPEVVLFGEGQKFELPLAVEAGPYIVVRGKENNQVVVSRFVVGQADQKRVVSSQVSEVIRAIVELGGDYPDVVQALQQAKSTHSLTSRLEFDALPDHRRSYRRKKSGSGESSGSGFAVESPMGDLFSGYTAAANTIADDAADAATEAAAAAAGVSNDEASDAKSE